MAELTYRTPEACALSGASYRQADHWARTSVLVPTIDARGSGTQRRYTLREVQAMWALTQLALLQHANGARPESRERAARALLEAEDFGGYLVVSPELAIIVPHVLALADLLTEVPAASVVHLDRCPVGQEVLVT